MTMAVIWTRPEFMADLWVVAWLVVATVGFVLALYWIIRDERADLAARRRLMVAAMFAVLLSSAVLSADYIITDICGPGFLRDLCGSWWRACYVVSGCPLLIY